MNRQNSWVPAGQFVRIAGHDIPGGLIYVGRHLSSAIGTIEPALINPALPVDQHEPVQPGRDIDPTPSYHLISPASRAAYLDWLAGGRARAEVPLGFLWLFFAGLERRVLVDLADDPAVRRELPTIAAEVRRLRAVHAPANSSFAVCTRAFLDVLELLVAPVSPPSDAPPAPHPDRWPVPTALRTGLARFAVGGTPVPTDWARSWAWFHPSLFPRTPQTRCPQQFEQLFEVRYSRRFMAGVVASGAERPPIRIGYQPASPGIDTVIVDRPDLPDMLEEPRATRELGTLVDEVTDALTPYSRWLARTPGGLGSLASTALLPADLLDRHPGPLGPLLTWANANLDGQSAVVFDASEFDAFWSTADPARMSRDEAASLALVLARVGLGVEPDVRFGGPPLAHGPAVLFRLDKGADQDAMDSPSPGYLAATTMLHLAAGMSGRSAAPGDTAGTANAIVAALAAEVRLSVTERSRLIARMRWLLACGATQTRIERRISALTATEREAAGHFLISVATAGPAPLVSPAIVNALTRAYRLLGLDTDLVWSRLHRYGVASAAGRPPPAEGPVVIRRARAGPPGHVLPRTPPEETTPEDQSRVRLSQEAITRKVAETATVSSMLAGIFADEGLSEEPSAAAGPAGLDLAHSRLLGELGTRSSWSRSDFADLAARHGVMPSGALDVINEVAMETVGEPVIEGDDEFIINDDALRELLA